MKICCLLVAISVGIILLNEIYEKTYSRPLWRRMSSRLLFPLARAGSLGTPLLAFKISFKSEKTCSLVLYSQQQAGSFFVACSGC